MVDYDPHSWVKLIFNNDSKNIFKQLWPPMLMLLIYTTAVVVIFNHFFNFHYPGGTAIHSLLGIVLGLFLVLEPILHMTVGGKEENNGGLWLTVQETWQ